MIIVILAIFIICGLMIAEAIIDYVFLGVYTVLLLAGLNSLTFIIKHYKKHKEIDFYCVGHIFLFIGLAVVVAIVKNTLFS